MKQKDKVELELAKTLKAARTGIRLAHSLAADEEINRRLPEIEAEFWAAVNNGSTYQLQAFEL